MGDLQRVLDIDGNVYVMDRLRELMASGEGIGFVGAGASAGLYPLWDELLQLLIGQAMRRGMASDADAATWRRTGARHPEQAIRGIRNRLGPPVYGAVLRDLFGYRTGPDERCFTPVHGALVQLGLRGFVTTNYDPGLLEARRVLRLDVRATGYATWQDSDLLRSWLSGDVFGPSHCPILYGHGVYERPTTIVLGESEYRDAYRTGPYRTLVSQLWAQYRMVFVGFGFNDAWFNVLAAEVLEATVGDAAEEPRHIAIVGQPEDVVYSPEIRALFRDSYCADVLLYPIRTVETAGVLHQDHGILYDVLVALSGHSPRSPAAPPQPSRPVPGPRPTARWVHDTTEDAHYVESAETLARLDRWADDPRVRAIAVTGIGGLGKTAIVGYWIKRREGLPRNVDGVFVWSCNANRSMPEFFEAFVQFASADLGIPVARTGSQVDIAIAALRLGRLLVVLDGLEILQEPPGELLPEGPGPLGYGEFLDEDLRTFLDAVCRSPHTGLVVLTSRFPFTDLTGHLGGSLRLLELEHLTPGEGATLLSRLDVGGTDVERQAVSKRYEGHPLALRVFAATLAHRGHGDPTRLLVTELAPASLRDDIPLEASMRHLLDFYSQCLTAGWRALLASWPHSRARSRSSPWSGWLGPSRVSRRSWDLSPIPPYGTLSEHSPPTG